jgi:hypothetical protein
MCRRRLGIAASASTALAIALLGAPRGMRAADDFDKVHAEAGRLWYDKYCTPCHGPAGAPGTAVYADTRKPVDLRNYIASIASYTSAGPPRRRGRSEATRDREAV